MPVDSVLVSAAVVLAFIIFAGVLHWGDLRTRPEHHETSSTDRKSRAF